MSHSAVLVVVREASGVMDAICGAEDALAPFDEGMEVEPYVLWQSEDEVQRAIGYYTENPTAALGPRPNKDDSHLTEWTRRAVGLWNTDAIHSGVHEDGKYGYRSTYNPRARWDWYSLGGRWRGFFQVKEGVKVGYRGGRGDIVVGNIELPAPRDNAEGNVEAVTAQMSAMLGETSTFGDAEGDNMQARADLARKGDIDFEAMRTLAGADADALYDQFEKVTEGLPVPPTWEQVRKNNGAIDSEAEGFQEAIDAARREFNDYEWVKALRSARMSPIFGDVHDYWCINKGGREKFIQRARNGATSTYAVLLDGEWHEGGWFGMDAEERDAETWEARQSALIDGLPDDAWLAVYDVHI